MNIYFLDAGGAAWAVALLWLLIIFMIIAILVEALVMKLMKYNTAFKKTLLDSFVANIVSLMVGFILLYSGVSLFKSNSDSGNSSATNTLINLLLLYSITVVVEFGVLYLLNNKKPVSKTFLASVVMNLVTYIILYVMGLLFTD